MYLGFDTEYVYVVWPSSLLTSRKVHTVYIHTLKVETFPTSKTVNQEYRRKRDYQLRGRNRVI